MNTSKLGLLLLPALAAAHICSGEVEHPQVFVSVSNRQYMIVFEVKKDSGYSVPLTNPIGQPHWAAKAQVWRKELEPGRFGEGVYERVRAPLDCQWTEKGCFEDDPYMLVAQAEGWSHWERPVQGGRMVTDSPAMRFEPGAPNKYEPGASTNCVTNLTDFITNLVVGSNMVLASNIVFAGSIGDSDTVLTNLRPPTSTVIVAGRGITVLTNTQENGAPSYTVNAIPPESKLIDNGGVVFFLCLGGAILCLSTMASYHIGYGRGVCRGYEDTMK